jgi:hypothetical protein
MERLVKEARGEGRRKRTGVEHIQEQLPRSPQRAIRLLVRRTSLHTASATAKASETVQEKFSHPENIFAYVISDYGERISALQSEGSVLS